MPIDFSTLGICEELTNTLKQNGIKEPTPVQEKSIPVLLEKKDIIAQAQTGTGKTLAFLLPIIQNIDPNKHAVQALIITPTRELALQITSEAKKYGATKELNILPAYGGQDVEKQVKKLKGAIHIVIGTPGRLLDHVRRKSIDFSKLSMIVLDEADQIMDMGFLPDVEKIIQGTPRTRQTMLFSATITRSVRMLISKHMKEPEQVILHTRNIILDEIKQKVIQTSDTGKQDALIKFIKEERPFMAIIFCKTKKRATTLNYILGNLGFITEELHGDMTQSKREKVLRNFRELKIHFLVATDIAARGLDIDGITHIINYDMPPDTESYIHRIGRTGRAGQAGVAITFATPSDRALLDTIEIGIRVKLEKQKANNEDHSLHQDASIRTRKPALKTSNGPKRFSEHNGKNTSSKKFNDRAPSTNKRSSSSRKPLGAKRTPKR